MKAICGSLALTAIAALSSPASADGPDGVWVTQDKKAHVRFAACGSGVFCGYLDWMDAKGKLAPGSQMIFNVTKTSANAYSGILVHPQTGKKYKGTMRMSGSNSMKLKGCIISLPFLCESQTWTKKN